MNEVFLTDEWQKYQTGLDYKRRIGLLTEVDKNERFFAGDQWNGVQAEGLPKPVVNVIKLVIQNKIASIRANATSIVISADGVPTDIAEGDAYNEQLSLVSMLLTAYFKTLWERLKMDSKNLSGMKDAAVTGDYILYTLWDSTIKRENGIKGDIDCELIDNVNYFPGNPNNTNVQKQPYIILAFREMVSVLRDEARANGIKDEQIKLISADLDYINQSGDRAKQELEDKGEADGKCICLLKFWKKDGKVYARKSCKSVVIRDEWDTKLNRFPISMMNWEERKNSVHGIAEVTSLIPNQIGINKILAALIIGVMNYAFPKTVFDNTRIKGISNMVGGSIPVNGDINGAFSVVNGGQISGEAFKMVDMLLEMTKQMSGINDAVLGNVNPDNTSAFIAIREAASVPLESIRKRFYQMVEDTGLIWLDFIMNYYGDIERKLSFMKDGKTMVAPFVAGNYKDILFNLKIEVGASSQWSEITSAMTLDKLLINQQIPIVQYLERMPDGYIPQKEKLISFFTDLEKKMEAQALQAQQSPIEDIDPDEIANSLSPEEQQNVLANPEILDQILNQGGQE